MFERFPQGLYVEPRHLEHSRYGHQEKLTLQKKRHIEQYTFTLF